MYGRIIRLAVLGLALVAAPSMAQRVAVTVTTAPGLYPTDGTAVTRLAADTSNLNKVQIDGAGKVLIMAEYVNALPGTTANVSIVSVADPITGRSGTIVADSISPWAKHVYGPFAIEGWRQTDGFIYCEADSTSVSFSAIKVP